MTCACETVVEGEEDVPAPIGSTERGTSTAQRSGQQLQSFGTTLRRRKIWAGGHLEAQQVAGGAVQDFPCDAAAAAAQDAQVLQVGQLQRRQSSVIIGAQRCLMSSHGTLVRH